MMQNNKNNRWNVGAQLRIVVPSPSSIQLLFAVSLLLVITIFDNPRCANALFVVDIYPAMARRRSMASTSILHMGKGFNKARNKQADLAKKMAIAKEQNMATDFNVPSTSTDNNKKKKEEDGDDSGGDERKRREDFETLLRTTKGALPSKDVTEPAYIAPMQAGSKTKKIVPKEKPPKKKTLEQQQQEEKEKLLKQKVFHIEVQRLHFESLIDVETSAPLGVIGAAKLVPWVPPYLKNCLIVFVDPRSNSNDLRRTIKYHSSSSSSDEGEVVFVTADSVGETRSWLKRNEIDLETSSSTPKIRIFSDPGLSFMTSYDIIGDGIDHRWSMTMLVFDTNGDILQLERDVDPSRCNELVASTISGTE